MSELHHRTLSCSCTLATRVRLGFLADAKSFDFRQFENYFVIWFHSLAHSHLLSQAIGVEFMCGNSEEFVAIFGHFIASTISNWMSSDMFFPRFPRRFLPVQSILQPNKRSLGTTCTVANCNYVLIYCIDSSACIGSSNANERIYAENVNRKILTTFGRWIDVERWLLQPWNYRHIILNERWYIAFH